MSDGHAPEHGDILETADSSLLDLVDNLIDKGVVLDGEVMLSLAGVDLVHLRLLACLRSAEDLAAGRADTTEH